MEAWLNQGGGPTQHLIEQMVLLQGLVGQVEQPMEAVQGQIDLLVGLLQEVVGVVALVAAVTGQLQGLEGQVVAFCSIAQTVLYCLLCFGQALGHAVLP